MDRWAELRRVLGLIEECKDDDPQPPMLWDDYDEATRPSAIAELLEEHDIAVCEVVKLHRKIADLERELAEARRDAIHRLAAFGWACLQEHRQEMADIDGFAAQELALKAGVIEEREVTEPCGDNCVCAEVADFPTRCYFIAEDCRRAMGTEPAAEEPQETLG